MSAANPCPAWCERHHWTRPHHHHPRHPARRADIGDVTVRSDPSYHAGRLDVYVQVRGNYPPWTGEQLFALADAMYAAGGMLERVAEVDALDAVGGVAEDRTA